MKVSTQVVVIGAGIVGASIAYHLALRGCTDVIMLEKDTAEISGSTARSAAGVRHQFSSPTNVQLSLYSIERLRHFTEEVGGYAELHQVGYLFLINDPATWDLYQRSTVMQRALGAQVDVLTPAEAARFVPGMHTDDLLGATYGPNDGYCDPYGIALGYLRRARDLGVRLLRETPAIGFQLQEGRVTAVETAAGPIGCEFVVNAAGPWAGEVAALAGLAVPVRPYRRNIYMTTAVPQPLRQIPFVFDVGSGFYMRNEGEGMLMGLANAAEPSSYNTQVDWAWLNTTLEAGLGRFPILETVGLVEQQCWAGLYEVTPDANPILGRHPQLPNYLDASGFSGHGIMHAPATGLLIAEEILDGQAHTIAIDELRINRFQRSALEAEQNVF